MEKKLYRQNIHLSLFSVAAGKPSANANMQGTPRSGNRQFMKGTKGSASLNRNENANQSAICYACGTTIRYICKCLCNILYKY